MSALLPMGIRNEGSRGVKSSAGPREAPPQPETVLRRCGNRGQGRDGGHPSARVGIARPCERAVPRWLLVERETAYREAGLDDALVAHDESRMRKGNGRPGCRSSAGSGVRWRGP